MECLFFFLAGIFCIIPSVPRLFLIVLLSSLYVHAQSVLMERYAVEDGLSQNLVTAMAQDRHGFIWFGTKDGLNRFDGSTFRIYRSSVYDSLTLQSNFISVLFVDASGVLWVGTMGGGLSRFNEATGTFTTFRHRSGDSLTIPSDYVNGILGGIRGSLIVSTIDGGIAFFDTLARTFSSLNRNAARTLPLSLSRPCLLDSDTVLWIGTRNDGLFRYKIATGELFHYPSGKGEKGPSDPRVKEVYRDSKGTYWIVTERGVDAFDLRTGIFTSHQIVKNGTVLPGAEIREISGDEYFLNVYVQCGVYNVRTRKFSPYEVSEGIPLTFVDKSGMLWLSTGGFGVLKYNPLLERFNKRNGVMWRDLFRDDIARAMKMKHVTYDEPLEIHTIIKDRDGAVWFQIPGRGVFRFDRGRVDEYRFNDPARGVAWNGIDRIFEDRSGDVWLSYDFNLAKYDNKRNAFTHHSLRRYAPSGLALTNTTEYDAITAVYKDAAGIFWFGTPSAGLIRFDEKDKGISLYKADAKSKISLSNNFILAIHDDPHDPSVLWIGTDGGGLNRFDTKSRSVTHRFSSADILPNDVVYGILSDRQGKFWMTSNNGMFVFDPAAMVVTARYDVNDGLQSNEFNRYEFWKDSTGRMYFGGINGWNSFYPDSITVRIYNPDIVLTDVKVMNHSVAYPRPALPLTTSLQSTKQIVLQPDQNMITFEFASLDYAAPKKNRYRYRLEGLNDHWIESGTERTAVYTNLDAGTYTFSAEGTNSDGVWSHNSATIVVTILPPYYKTWWFQSGAAVMVILAVTFSVRSRFSRLKKEKEMQQKFSRQVLEQQEQDRERIAAELHDSLGQNLLVVKNRAVLGMQTTKEDQAAADHFRNISSIISDTLKEVRTIAHNLRPYQLDSLGLTETIRSAVNKISGSTRLSIEMTIDDIDDTVQKEHEINLFRIVQECFNNILKHSGATKAEIAVRRTSSSIVIVISDNGKGMTIPLSNGNGFGMMGIQERVRILNGTMMLESQPGSGTTITMTIPV